MGNLERISLQLATLLNDQNVRTIQATMRSAAAASASWKDIGEQLGPVVGKLDPLVNNLTEASLEARDVARDISAVIREARTAIAHLDAPDGPLVMATRSLREITYAAARLSNDTLPAVSTMADDVSATARGMSTMIHEVGDMPQSIIFGLPPPRPGPGEPGFQGFGRGQ